MTHGGESLFWNDDRVKLLRKLHAQRGQIDWIAAQLGTSPGAVEGKLKRLGLGSTRQAQRGSDAGLRNLMIAKQAAPVETVEPDLVEPPSSEAALKLRCTLLQLTSTTCRWPHGDPREESFRFCGAECEPERSYCVACERRARAPRLQRAA